MLEIYTDNIATDLPSDISIDLMFENPLFSPAHIPAPYSLSYDLPLTATNRQIFGNPDRIAAAGNRFRKHPTRILFAGIEIASGVQTIEEIGETITVNFSGSVLPDWIDHKLYKVPMEVLELPTYNSQENNEDIAQITYDGRLRTNLTAENAPFVACPIAIKDSGEVDTPNPDDSADKYLMTRKSFLNLTSSTSTYLHYAAGMSPVMLKILPAFKVWYIFDAIFGDKLVGNIFSVGDWEKLCVQSLWHPNFQLSDNLPPWTWTPGANHPTISVRLQDFMPNVTAAEFVIEMLKIPCATMFIRGDSFAIESNNEILNRNIFHDWVLEDGATISLEPGQKYEIGYSTADSGDQADVEIKAATNVVAGLMIMDGEERVTAFRSLRPPQILQADSESTPHMTVVKLENTEEEDEDDPSEESTYDMTIKAEPVRCNVRRWWYQDADLTSGIVNRFYIPEIDKVETKRPDTILLGLYQGIKKMIRYSGTANTYPYLSSSNYDAYGNKLGYLTLDFDASGSLSAHHTTFKAWIEKDKLVVSGVKRLSAIELHNFDIRDKFHVQGRNFLLRSMNIPLRINRIDPAEVELVEC